MEPYRPYCRPHQQGVEPDPVKILKLIIDNGQDIDDVRNRL